MIRPWSVALCAGAIVCAVVVAMVLSSHPDSVAPSVPSIVAGTPGGLAVENAIPSPSLTPVPTAPLSATPDRTDEPPVVQTPMPVIATPVATPATTPPSVTPPPVIVAVADPTDAVAAFYDHVSSGRFDAAYSLWSDRMRATYPRQENIDERFAQTTSIAFQQLSVAEATSDRATVQANFTERYASGSSRVFVGYWRLILVDGIWLLDEPHY